MSEQKRENGLLARGQSLIRDIMLAVFGNEALFLIVAFLYATLGDNAIAAWYREPVSLLYGYIVIPWGAALCLLRLQRRAASLEPARADVVTLFVLYLWILVPFAIRFGFTGKNATAWHGYAVMFFGIYASISERKQREREMLMATMSVLSAVFAYVFCGALLFCAWSGTIYAADLGPFGFGVVNGWLCSGVHYNITGMIVISLCMMCVMGVGYYRNILLKLFCLIPAVMSMVVIVLSQSRTSRYALLAVLAAAAFDGVRRALCCRNVAAGLLAAVLAGAVVLGGGYWGADRMTRAAIAHYNQLAYDAALQAALAEQAEAQQAEPSAEETTAAEEPTEPSAEEAPVEAVEPSAEETTMEAPVEPSAEETTAETPVEPSAEETPVEAPVESAEPPVQEAAAEPAVPEIQISEVQARELANADGSFNNRTDIWRAVFMLWHDNPKMMMIGNGVNQTGHKIGQYISWTDGVAVHNAYLQWAADFGLIGLVPQIVFLAIAVWQTIRVFFASKRPRGALGLCMMAFAGLLIGMMESATLSAMLPINLMFMFALAQLSAMSRDIAKK